jgi:aspartyl/asparaginyl-tRNA synthetase
MSPRLVFLVFREQLTTVQGVLQAEESRMSENMVRWTEHLRSGPILLVTGKVQRHVQDVTGTSVHDAKVLIDNLHVMSERTDPVPFSVSEAEMTISDIHEISERTRLAHRVLDLRTPTSQAIFRIQSGVCSLFRGFLESKGFVEIHTPKLQGGATEGGSSVFKLDYFGRLAFLAQSPQLAKQMCISADFG